MNITRNTSYKNPGGRWEGQPRSRGESFYNMMEMWNPSCWSRNSAATLKDAHMDFAIHIPFLASSCLLMSSLASASKNHTKTQMSQMSRKSGESTSQAVRRISGPNREA